MRKLTQLVLLSVALLATPAFAQMKVAVLNYQMALLESDAAKRYAVDAEKKFGPQLNKLKTLESDAKRIQDRLVKDGDKMQTAERERLELEFKQKARDFQFQSKELNEAKAIADREMLANKWRTHLGGGAVMRDANRLILKSGGKVIYTPSPRMTQIYTGNYGGGIDAAVMDRLFEPFQSAAGGTGIGLGLSICRQIAESMQAQVQLFNRVQDDRVVGVDAVVRWNLAPASEGGPHA